MGKPLELEPTPDETLPDPILNDPEPERKLDYRQFPGRSA